MAVSNIGRERKAKAQPGKPPSVRAFRERITELIATRFHGKYTVLAKRAGIPVSTMQHYMHSAKHIPGGEHVARIAEALGVTIDHLVTGSDVIRASDLLARPVVFGQGGTGEMSKLKRHIEVAVFECTCPEDCVFAHEPLPVGTAEAQVFVPVELVYHWPRLVGLHITYQLGWTIGTRLILDWDARSPGAGNDKFLYRLDGRCQLGRLQRSAEGLLVMIPPSTPGKPDVAMPVPRTLPPDKVEVLGKIVTVIGPP
jgi:transcriptional regulator with XRE-family HTH domain